MSVQGQQKGGTALENFIGQAFIQAQAGRFEGHADTHAALQHPARFRRADGGGDKGKHLETAQSAVDQVFFIAAQPVADDEADPLRVGRGDELVQQPEHVRLLARPVPDAAKAAAGDDHRKLAFGQFLNDLL